MKYICLSFDDARSDTYEYAFPILRKYGLKATVNVISDFVNHKERYSFESAPEPMSVSDIIQWEKAGFEVACHGATHQNTLKDVENNIVELEQFGVNVKNIGFASPHSYITAENIHETGIEKLKENGEISYIRTGIQVMREGGVYTFLSVIEMITHGKRLYYLLNRRNAIEISNKPELLPSAAIKDYTSLKQIQFFINEMKDNQAIILMFHSILPETDSNYGKDHYYWSAQKFERLCMWLSISQDLTVLTTHELICGREDNK